MEDPVVPQVHLQALMTPLTAQQGTSGLLFLSQKVCSQHNSSSNTGRVEQGVQGGGWGCLDLISQDVLCVFGNLSFSLQKAGWAPAIRSPSIHSPPTSRENLTFKSPTHTYWTAVLSPVQIGKREMERRWVEKSVMEKDIQAFGYWVGKENNTAQLSKPSYP
ncbi:putative outer membrane protein pmp16 [Dissostichus eleginoides]|uniref:Outer membrane protein pmp16 n=1 Tax=Dissostichus eleginoides TaxID=100907 RepID=A0AAD9CLF9_DISEL|nr:putative outer membrane protein pmp16 [Dissostichus eleginoides]